MVDSSNESDRNESRTISRRKILKSATVSGAISVGGFSGATVTAKTSSRDVRIVTARGGVNHEAIETKKVPKKWRQHELATRKVVREIQNEFMDYDIVESISRGVSGQKIQGQDYSEIWIEYDQNAAKSEVEALPSTLEEAGISVPNSVKVSTIRKNAVPGNAEPVCSGEFTDDPLPGGLWCDGVNTGGSGTAGYRIHNSDGEYILTANHVASDGCEVDSHDLYTWNGDHVGPIVDGHAVHDYAIVEPDGSGVTGISDAIWHNGGDKVWISGYKNKSGCEDLKGKTGAVKKQGHTTGYQEGTLQNVDECEWGSNGCIRMDCEGVDVKVETAHGDSGGPIWDDASDGARVITQASLAKGDTIGTASCNGSDIWARCVGFATYTIMNNQPYAMG